MLPALWAAVVRVRCNAAPHDRALRRSPRNGRSLRAGVRSEAHRFGRPLAPDPGLREAVECRRRYTPGHPTEAPPRREPAPIAFQGMLLLVSGRVASSQIRPLHELASSGLWPKTLSVILALVRSCSGVQVSGVPLRHISVSSQGGRAAHWRSAMIGAEVRNIRVHSQSAEAVAFEAATQVGVRSMIGSVLQMSTAVAQELGEGARRRGKQSTCRVALLPHLCTPTRGVFVLSLGPPLCIVLFFVYCVYRLETHPRQALFSAIEAIGLVCAQGWQSTGLAHSGYVASAWSDAPGAQHSLARRLVCPNAPCPPRVGRGANQAVESVAEFDYIR